MEFSYTPDTLLNCVQLAAILEVSGYPKPGNVHRTRDFQDTRYEHFLVGGIVIRKAFQALCKNSLKIYNNKLDYSELKLGKYILEAVNDSLSWHHGGNTNLGVILLLVPMVAAASMLQNEVPIQESELRDLIDIIIKKSTYLDTINLYKAIRTAKAGGLGKVDKFDINNESSFTEIKRNRVNLYKIFDLSKERDTISMEWVSKFKITFELGVPYFIKTFDETKCINTSTVNTFLKIASEVPDSLIIRTHGLEMALDYSKKASDILSKGGLKSHECLNELIKWENNLLKTGIKINPGTTADLTAAVLFIALLSGIRF